MNGFSVRRESRTQWQGLSLIDMAESERQIGEQITVERCYFISSLEGNVEQFGQAVSKHWSTENSLWVLGVASREDESRVKNTMGRGIGRCCVT